MQSILGRLALAGLVTAAFPHAGQAAESYDSCTGFIDALPATITTQGIWCLRKDLTTAISSGAAITIANNNVTIDCNGFKLGGLSAGPGTQATGILADDRANATVRNCNVRGFAIGIDLVMDLPFNLAGHVVEDNRLDGNTYMGVRVHGSDVLVRRNMVLDTGGSTALLGFATGILTRGDTDILDNTVSGVQATPDPELEYTESVGIVSWWNAAGTIGGNRVRGITSDWLATGIVVAPYDGEDAHRTFVTGNVVIGTGEPDSAGITCHQGEGHAIRVRGNTVSQVAATFLDCGDAGDNVVALLGETP